MASRIRQRSHTKVVLWSTIHIGELLLSSKELGDFLREQCKERKLSLRSLSIKSGLSPATVYNILNRKYQPSLFSLNHLADYLGVEREYLWQLAGLVAGDHEGQRTDPQLRFHFARVDKLPMKARKLVISLIEAVIVFLEEG